MPVPRLKAVAVSNGRISGSGGRFQISGDLNFDTVTGLLEESKATLFASPVTQLDLDLSGVTRADSAGLALLLQWMRMARANECDIHYHHLPEQLLAIARPGELDSLLPVSG
jgi:phospholipid transport system transporter-binding protein